MTYWISLFKLGCRCRDCPRGFSRFTIPPDPIGSSKAQNGTSPRCKTTSKSGENQPFHHPVTAPQSLYNHVLQPTDITLTASPSPRHLILHPLEIIPIVSLNNSHPSTSLLSFLFASCIAEERYCHMPSNRSFFSQFIGSLIGFRPRSPSGSPLKSPASPFNARRRSTSSLNGKERDMFLNSGSGEKWWIGGRRADGSERYYPIAPIRYLPTLAPSLALGRR